MPEFRPDRLLEAPGQRYSLRKPKWIRDRILAFVTGHDGQTAERVVQQIQYVAMLPRSEDKAYVFVPSTHFLLQMGSTEARTLKGSLEKRLKQHEAELGVHLQPVIHQRDLAKGETGILAGTGLHLAADKAKQRGILGLELEGSGTIVEAQLTLVTGVDAFGAGFYPGQAIAIVGVDPAFPVRFALATETALSMLDPDMVLYLQKPSPAARPTVSFETLCKDSLAVLTGGGAGKTDPGRLHSLLMPEPAQAIRPKTVEFEAATGWARLELGAEMTRNRVGSADPARVVLHVRPDVAYTRLLHSDAKLEAGGFAVVGLLLPLPGTMPGVTESFCHLDREGQITAHALDHHETTLVVERPSGLWSRLRGPVARCLTEDGTAGRPVRIEKRLRRINPLPLSVHLGVTSPNPPFAIKNEGTAFARIEESFVLVAAPQNRALGYFRSPLALGAAAGDPGPFRAPVTMARTTLKAPHEVCLDWLDDAAGVIQRDETGWSERMGLAEYFQLASGPADTDPVDMQALVLAKTRNGGFALHLEDRGADGSVTLVPVVPNGVYRIGPLVCRYVMPAAAGPYPGTGT